MPRSGPDGGKLSRLITRRLPPNGTADLLPDPLGHRQSVAGGRFPEVLELDLSKKHLEALTHMMSLSYS